MKKPILRANHKDERYRFTKGHIRWTVDDWKRVMLSDETVISRTGSFGRKYYYSRPKHKCFQPLQVPGVQQGGGGKMLLWGCVTYNGVGDLEWIKGKMDTAFCVHVLCKDVFASREYYHMDPATSIFQQDNA